jgi:hypothetical protein
MTTGATSPHDGPARPAGHGTRTCQRFGHVTGHRPTPAARGERTSTYLVRDDDTGTTYAFDSADIVTEGLRTLRPGERIRFLADPGNPGHAVYIIRLDLPDTEEYYK